MQVKCVTADHQGKVKGQTTSQLSKNRDRCSKPVPYHDFQHPQYLSDKIKKNSSAQLVFKIQKASIECGQGMDPRTFCRRWFGLDAITEDGRDRFTKGQILAMESEHGYREKCINLLAKILQIKPNTIHRWGKGVNFDKIPADKRQKYEIYLGYVDAIRIISTSLTELDTNSLLRLLRRLETR